MNKHKKEEWWNKNAQNISLNFERWVSNYYLQNKDKPQALRQPSTSEIIDYLLKVSEETYTAGVKQGREEVLDKFKNTTKYLFCDCDVCLIIKPLLSNNPQDE